MTTFSDSSAASLQEAIRQERTNAAPAWRARAAGLAEQSRAATAAILKAARVLPGMRVLDIATGTGEPALSLARAVGPARHVTATELVAEMLVVAAELAGQQALSNITFPQADAAALPFADASFDAVTSRFGVMYFPHLVAALQETRRPGKSGGYNP